MSKGEGCMILCIILFVVAILGILYLNSLWYPTPGYTSLQLRMTEVARCEATEEFTRDQCVILVGGE